GIFVAVLYTILSGFNIPAFRALVAYVVLTSRNFTPYRFRGWDAWRAALGLVLLTEPHAVMFPGFYLSFAASGILIGVNQRVKVHFVKQMLLTQLACLVGLLPLTLYFFGYASLNGFLANLLAIPWVSFVVLPLGLFATLLSIWCPHNGLIYLVHVALNVLLQYLNWVDGWSFINLQHLSITSAWSVVFLLGGLCLLVWIPLPAFLPALVVGGLAVIFPVVEPISMNDARIDVLDVGQGLAVVVRTAGHTLIYDTGMRYAAGHDMGRWVLVPYLHQLGIKRIDTVVISHPDLDHRGGLESLREAYPVGRILVDQPHQYTVQTEGCHGVPPWSWDGVQFQFFPILNDATSSKNNRSC
ncbi:MAG: DNA internalization-related competence protein ComEC/Rec2, partial [Legionella sp. 21-45-4]